MVEMKTAAGIISADVYLTEYVNMVLASPPLLSSLEKAGKRAVAIGEDISVMSTVKFMAVLKFPMRKFVVK